MMHRLIAVLLCASSIGLIVLGYHLSHPNLVGWCEGDAPGCVSQSMLFGIGHPLLSSIRWLPFFFFALIFVSKEVFHAWWKFALWFSILPLLFIVSSQPFASIPSPNRVQVTEWMTQLFVIASALFIAWKYWQIRKAGKK